MVYQAVTFRGSFRPALVARAGLVLLCLVLTGCSWQEEAPSTSGATVVPTSTRAVVTTDLGEVVWASEIDPTTSAPIDRREAFPRDHKRVYAVLETGQLAAGTTLTAAWAFNSQPIDGKDVTLSTDTARSAGWVEFHLEWTDTALWPVGILAVEITASSGESTRGTVEIQGA